MRSAWLIVLAACGGASKPAATPVTATDPSSIVATNEPQPPPPPPTVTGGDPCMGGEVTPMTKPPGGTDSLGQGTIGTGNPCGGPPRRGHGPVVHLPPNASVDGPLDKAIIRRYIKRNIQKIQYCYESELLGHPGLAGTVTAKFVIGADGLVAKSEASGIAGVDACVAKVIQGIEFPKPKGAQVNVTYPFTFSPTAD